MTQNESHHFPVKPRLRQPACPNQTEKPAFFALLKVTAATGIILTDGARQRKDGEPRREPQSRAISPASSVSGMYLNHPDSKYFAVGKLGKDQIADYATRKKISVAEAEKWLNPLL
ncbi:MAG: hypothetical protein JNK23_00435 [Opitutaceae bacterium]|nr:hypothetical protein [Opitutaceae bacterium]